jgi:hypothetical protein
MSTKLPDNVLAGYLATRQLPDGRWIGVQRLLFATGLFVDLDDVGYAFRYCYETEAEAFAAMAAWDGTGEAPGDWIKRKGRDGDVTNPERVACGM